MSLNWGSMCLLNNLLSIIAEGRCFRWGQVIQMTVQHVKTKEAHLRQSHHCWSAGNTVGNYRAPIT